MMISTPPGSENSRSSVSKGLELPSGARSTSPITSHNPSRSKTRLIPIISRHFCTLISTSESGKAPGAEILDLSILARSVSGKDPVVSMIVALMLGLLVGRCESRIEASMLRDIYMYGC